MRKSANATARLFVAVDPPALARERLASWARAALGAGVPPGTGGVSPRLLDRESLHVTLCFLGNRPTGEIGHLAAAVRASARTVGELSLGAPLWLPARRPRVLGVEVHDPDGELEALRNDLVSALAHACEAELTLERRRFRPHVTVARLSERRPPHQRQLDPTPAMSFLPDSLVLYRSRLGAHAAAYEPLSTASLRSEAPGREEIARRAARG